MANLHITPPPLSPQSMGDLLCTIMLLVKCKRAGGQPFWAYMCIKPSMAKIFKDARDKGDFQLEDYGTVIEWGEGADVPQEVKHRMKQEYGVNDNYEEELLKAIIHYKNKFTG